MQLIDIGVNLTHASFAPEREASLARARATGVVRMMTTGTSLADSKQTLQLYGGFDGSGRLFITAGVYPHEASHQSADIARGLRALLDNQRVYVVGECGLDFNRDFSPRPVQEKTLEEQLALTVELQRLAFPYERDVSERPLTILHGFRDRLSVVIVHYFTGERRTLYGCLDLDLHIGITGWINDERRGTHLHDLVGEIPVGRPMLESDTSYLLPCSLWPKPKNGRNEPAYLVEAFACVARHRGESTERLAAHTNATMRAFFGLPMID